MILRTSTGLDADWQATTRRLTDLVQGALTVRGHGTRVDPSRATRAGYGSTRVELAPGLRKADEIVAASTSMASTSSRQIVAENGALAGPVSYATESDPRRAIAKQSANQSRMACSNSA